MSTDEIPTFHVQHRKMGFRVVGQTVDGDEFTETFRCLPTVPVSVIRTMGKEGDFEAVLGFLALVMHPEDRDRWTALLDDEVRLVDADVIREVAEHLMEKYAARPTGRPGSSPPGPPASGNGSTVVSPSPASIPIG